MYHIDHVYNVFKFKLYFFKIATIIKSFLTIGYAVNICRDVYFQKGAKFYKLNRSL